MKTSKLAYIEAMEFINHMGVVFSNKRWKQLLDNPHDYWVCRIDRIKWLNLSDEARECVFHRMKVCPERWGRARDIEIAENLLRGKRKLRLHFRKLINAKARELEAMGGDWQAFKELCPWHEVRKAPGWEHCDKAKVGRDIERAFAKFAKTALAANGRTAEIITGATGSGKTYQAIHQARSLGSFAYLAPCRQLAVEAFTFYGTADACLSSGDLRIEGVGDFFGVYETDKDLSAFDSIIIDEAHYLTSYDRGGELVAKILKAAKAGQQIFLLSATLNFTAQDLVLAGLASRITKLPAPSLPKPKKVEPSVAWERLNDGVPTIEFVKRQAEADLSAMTLPHERLRLQFAFQRGEIKHVTATNVLAQGLNFPCQNLIIHENGYEHELTIKQKIGRLGRPGFTTKDDTLTWCLQRNFQPCREVQREFQTRKIAKPRKDRFDDFRDVEWTRNDWERVGHDFGYWYYSNRYALENLRTEERQDPAFSEFRDWFFEELAVENQKAKKEILEQREFLAVIQSNKSASQSARREK